MTVTLGGGGVQVVLLPGLAPAQAEEETEALEEGPSPIAPEAKELLWGIGAFVVFLVLMRLVLFPKLKKGMDARYGKIRADHEEADAVREQALREVADYQAELDTVKAEAASRVDAVRRQLDNERSGRLTEVNQQIAEQRAAAATAAEERRAAARSTVEAAVVAVTTALVERSTGRAPDAETVRRAASDVMSVGASS
ncbi:MAG: ATP synthase F0 subunit B [Acidimicrobiia bacterium]|nr:ATP synthase F0 subunit B [Acidimicrobiia bacterium]